MSSLHWNRIVNTLTERLSELSKLRSKQHTKMNKLRRQLANAKRLQRQAATKARKRSLPQTSAPQDVWFSVKIRIQAVPKNNPNTTPTTKIILLDAHRHIPVSQIPAARRLVESESPEDLMGEFTSDDSWRHNFQNAMGYDNRKLTIVDATVRVVNHIVGDRFDPSSEVVVYADDENAPEEECYESYSNQTWGCVVETIYHVLNDAPNIKSLTREDIFDKLIDICSDENDIQSQIENESNENESIENGDNHGATYDAYATDDLIFESFKLVDHRCPKCESLMSKACLNNVIVCRECLPNPDKINRPPIVRHNHSNVVERDAIIYYGANDDDDVFATRQGFSLDHIIEFFDRHVNTQVLIKTPGYHNSNGSAIEIEKRSKDKKSNLPIIELYANNEHIYYKSVNQEDVVIGDTIFIKPEDCEAIMYEYATVLDKIQPGRLIIVDDIGLNGLVECILTRFKKLPKVLSATRYHIMRIRINNCEILADPDHESKQKALTKLREIYPQQYEFSEIAHSGETVSRTGMAVALFETMFEKLPKGYDSETDHSIIKRFFTRPVIQTFEDPEKLPQGSKIRCFDLNLAYLNILKECENVKIPIFSAIDNFATRCDAINSLTEHVVKNVYVRGYELKTQILNGYIVRWMLDQNIINKDQIIYSRKASQYFDGSKLAKYATFLDENFEKNERRLLYTAFCGYTGIRESKKSKSFLTTDPNMLSKPTTGDLESSGNLHISNKLVCESPAIYVQTCEQTTNQQSNSASIFRYILSCLHKKMIEMVKIATFATPSGVISAFVDSIYVVYPKNSHYYGPLRSSFKEEFNKTPIKPREFTQPRPTAPPPKNGSITTGIAGSGKSYNMLKKIDAMEPPQVLVCAVQNLMVERLKQKSTLQNKKNFMTLDMLKYGYYDAGRTAIFRKAKALFIDEFTMVDSNRWNFIAEICDTYNLELHIYGDPNQLDPINSDQIGLNSKFIRTYCPVAKCLEYREESARYDVVLKDSLDHFLETGKLDENLLSRVDHNSDHGFSTNFCFYNKTRHRVNADLKEKYAQTDINMICKLTVKSRNCFNGQIMKKSKIDEEDLKYYEPALCITTHKSQGGETTENYGIYDVMSFSKNMMYVALSRAKTTSQIHIYAKRGELENRIFKKLPKQPPQPSKIIPKNHKIYELKSITLDKSYYGMTKQTVQERFDQHKNSKYAHIKALATAPDATMIKLYDLNETRQFRVEAVEKKVMNWYKHYHTMDVINDRCADPTTSTTSTISRRDAVRDAVRGVITATNISTDTDTITIPKELRLKDGKLIYRKTINKKTYSKRCKDTPMNRIRMLAFIKSIYV